MKTFRADVESFVIRPGLLTPKLVCLQYAIDDDSRHYDGAVAVILAAEARETWLAALADPDVLLEFHNGSFDLAVLANAFPESLPLIFRALGAGRGRDTYLREMLNENALGTLQNPHPKGFYSLGGIAERRCGLNLDKGEDSWRLRYALLDGVPVDQWPPEALKYAKDDVTSLRAVSRNQSKTGHTSPDEWFQVAAAFALQLAAVWGVRTDPEAHAAMVTRLTTEREAAQALLDEAGFFRDGSVDKKAVQAAVERACAVGKVAVPKTAPTGKFPLGQTKTDAETIETVAAHDAGLNALVTHGGLVKNLSTYMAPLELGTRYAVTSRPNVLVATGRTSWGGSKLKQTNPWWPKPPNGYDYDVPEEIAGTSMQVWPRVAGIRDCIAPRVGFQWASVDYDSLEVRSFAQVLLWVVGYSVMAQQYQKDPDFDPHTYFAANLEGIDYKEGLRRKATDKAFKKGPRQRAKAAVFGIPGGMGARKFVQTSKIQYDIDMTENEARLLKEAYLETFPEVRAYFEYMSWLAESGQTLRQFVSGRIRGQVGYCDGCNSLFQGLAAEGAKRALFAVTQAAYVEPDSPLFGSRPTAFIHDEICLEVPSDRAHEACSETERLMVREMSLVLPDIPVRASPALSTRWLKAAEAKYSPDGRLVAWDG